MRFLLNAFLIFGMLIILHSQTPQLKTWAIHNKLLKFDPTTGVPITHSNLPIPPIVPATGTSLQPNNSIINTTNVNFFTVNNPGSSDMNYEGTTSKYPENAMYDVDGNLLFFVEYGNIYDKDGYYIAKIFAFDDDGNERYARGTNAVHIVPVPGECCKYYIMAFTPEETSSGGGVGPENFMVVMKLNMCELNPYFSDNAHYGFIESPYGWDGVPTHYYPEGNIISFENSGAFVDVFHTISLPTYGSVEMYSAVTPIVNNPGSPYNGTYLMFTSGSDYTNVFSISSSGITRVNATDFYTKSASLDWYIETNDGEYEVYKKNDNDYTLAFIRSFTYVGGGNFIYPVSLFYFDLSSATLTTEYYLPAINETTPPIDGVHSLITGLEFSPDGNSLYVSVQNNNGLYAISTVHPIVTFFTPLNTFLPSTNQIIAPDEFGSGYIERGRDGNLYFISNNRIGRLENPNNLSSLVWTDNILTSLGSSQSLTVNPGEYFKLPNQIDDQDLDYSVDLSPSSACCEDLQHYANGKLEYVSPNGTFLSPITLNWTNMTNPFGVTGAGTVTIYIKRNITISQYTNLNISNIIFKFAPDARFIIRNNTKIKANNCTFTSIDCDGKMWDGIELQGNENFPQSTNPAGSPNYRNPLLILNSCKISNAIVGISAAQRNTANTYLVLTGGGVIQSNSTEFLNNQVDVDMERYLLSPTNLSFYKRSTFHTNGILKNPLYASLTNQYHVKLSQVRGVKFTGCTFANDNITFYPTIISRGSGIYAFDSKIYVSEDLTIPATLGSFSNFRYGIHSAATSSTRNLSCKNTVFLNNSHGILAIGSDYNSIVGNYFEVGANYPILITHRSYGIRLDNCSYYEVMDNSFVTTHNGYYGLYVYNSGTATNRIFRNSFTNLTESCLASRINDGNSDEDGLDFQCNNYLNSKTVDIGVVGGGLTEPNSTINVGISDWQGQCINLLSGSPDLSSPANNNFTSPAPNVLGINGIAGTLWQNSSPTSSVEQIDYTYTSSSVFQTDPSLGIVGIGAPINSTSGNTLLSNCGTPPTSNPPFDFSNYSLVCPTPTYGHQPLRSENKQFRAIIANNNKKIDGNNTPTLLNYIATHNNNAQVKSFLQTYSPYLSDTVLLALINKLPAYAPWVIQDLVLAQTPLSETVLLALLNHSPSFPPYIIADAFINSRPLTQTAMIAFINKSTLPQWVLRDVLVANSPLHSNELIAFINRLPSASNATLNDVLLRNTPLTSTAASALSAKIPAPAPWVLNNIANSNYVAPHPDSRPISYSPIGLLVYENAYYQRRINLNRNEDIREFLNDTTLTEASYDSIISRFQIEDIHFGKCQEIIFTLERGDVLGAKTLNEALKALSITELNPFCQLMDRILMIELSPNRAYEILYDDDLRIGLEEIAGFSESKENKNAQAILHEILGYSYDVPVHDLEGGMPERMMSWYITPIFPKSTDESVNLFPNPNNGIFTIAYYPEYDGILDQLKVYDVSGKVIMQQNVNIESGSKKEISLELSTGIYFVDLIDNTGNKKTVKMIVK